MKGLVTQPLLPIPLGRSSKEFTGWLFLREVPSGSARKQPPREETPLVSLSKLRA
jgi:hypothetical protein